MAEAGFVCAAHTTALFFPPSSRRFWLRSARTLEKAGRNWGPDRLGGVLIVEAMRRDTATPRGLRVAERMPLRVLEGIPVSGAQPAWRETAARRGETRPNPATNL